MTAYYNEIDPYAAAWLRNLIAAGHIADGIVDERSIVDVQPEDLAGFTQVHLFAGIGGWSHAARLAGWPDDRPLWTGSCPCQPFSVAGKGAGTADERHLWPEMHRLVAAIRPPVVVGEQVASRAGLDWLDGVCADLEGEGYATGAIDLCAAGVGAPHIRQRLWWVAYASSEGPQGRGSGWGPRPGREGSAVERGGEAGGMADAKRRGCESRTVTGAGQATKFAAENGKLGWMGDADSPRYEGDGLQPLHGSREGRQQISSPAGPSTTNLWSSADWIPCRDGKSRPVEPGTQQMADGISCGVGLLRAHPDIAEEIRNAASIVDLSEQTMRAVRAGYGAQEIWQSLGGCIGFPAATVLLAHLCEQSRELGLVFNRAAAGSAQNGEVVLRALLPHLSADARPPYRPGHPEQFRWELGDTLPKLSQAGAFKGLAQFTGSPLAHGVSNRVGRLRAFGNAIVPQIAAQVLIATSDLVANRLKPVANGGTDGT